MAVLGWIPQSSRLRRWFQRGSRLLRRSGWHAACSDGDDFDRETWLGGGECHRDIRCLGLQECRFWTQGNWWIGHGLVDCAIRKVGIEEVDLAGDAENGMKVVLEYDGLAARDGRGVARIVHCRIAEGVCENVSICTL